VKYKYEFLNGTPKIGITKNLSIFPDAKVKIFKKKNLKSEKSIEFFVSKFNLTYRNIKLQNANKEININKGKKKGVIIL
tara:strand:+ start:179 stop:415 length:237 start_codon:yes stop_codon:yes gene_type:complete